MFYIKRNMNRVIIVKIKKYIRNFIIRLGKIFEKIKHMFMTVLKLQLLTRYANVLD